MDFGQLADQVEFLSVVDRGTSILVDTQTDHHFNAETALLAVAKLLLFNDLPQKLRFDRDSRFLSSWAMDGYPSPLLRFLLCIGVEPDPTPPRRPDLKPFVERRYELSSTNVCGKRILKLLPKPMTSYGSTAISIITNAPTNPQPVKTLLLMRLSLIWPTGARSLKTSTLMLGSIITMACFSNGGLGQMEWYRLTGTPTMSEQLMQGNR